MFLFRLVKKENYKSSLTLKPVRSLIGFAKSSLTGEYLDLGLHLYIFI